MRYGAANVTTIVILGFALWVVFTRLRNRPDNNWAMVFYPVVTIFATQLPGRIDINTLMAGIVAALVLRFEFVGGYVTHIVRVVDLAALLAIAYYLFQSTY